MGSLATIGLEPRYEAPLLGQVLNVYQAKYRLTHLNPQSAEATQLQRALLKASGIVEIILPTLSYKVNATPPDDQLKGGFGASEHMAIGEKVTLKGISEGAPVPVLQVGRVALFFQDIIALAGDFYGVPGGAISLPGGTPEEKMARFEAAFTKLVEGDDTVLRKVLFELHQEYHAVQHSGLPHHCYSNLLMEQNRVMEEIKSDVGELLMDNSDHFSSHAREAYRIGHLIAITKAQEAGRAHDLDLLKRAYAIEAFACHFLTDLFSAGHIRNQRGELEKFLLDHLDCPTLFQAHKGLAAILTGAQHEKDGNEGLNVHNERGDVWRAYGDGCHFTPKNRDNLKRVKEATQRSVDEVHAAYENPQAAFVSTVQELIPQVSAFNRPPLYSISEDGHSLFLHYQSEKEEVTTLPGYLKEGLAQALRVLPEDYVSSFIRAKIDKAFPAPLKLAGKAIALPFRLHSHLSGLIWHMAGVATYRHMEKYIDKANSQLHFKISELAQQTQATYENSLRIIETLERIEGQLNQVAWNQQITPIKAWIFDIKNAFENGKYFRSLNAQQMSELENAHTKLGTAFSTSEILQAYRKNKAQEDPSLSPRELTIEVTLWYREILNYQHWAVGMWCASEIQRDVSRQDYVRNVVIAGFEQRVHDQIDRNAQWIDLDLLFVRPEYLNLQRQKAQITRQALKQLTQ